MSPSRPMTRTYAAALCVIALLALASDLTLERVLSAQDGSAAAINDSGRQRMLSQRIALDAALYVLGGDTAAREALRQAAGRLEAAHARLSRDAALSPATRALYFSPPAAVDRTIREYLYLAQTIADPSRRPAEPVVRAAFAQLSDLALGPIVASLDAIVDQHQRESDTRVGTLHGFQLGLLAILLATLAAQALLVFRPMARRLREHAAELDSLACLDPLTGVWNLRSFRERGAAEVARTRRHGGFFSVLMLDGDLVGRINGMHGHAAGDEALRSLVRTVGGLLRPSDVLGRVGSEEFAVLLPETPLDGAVELGRRICRTVSETTAQHDGASFALAVSIGATTLGAGETSLDAALKRADLALYRARQGGRNQVAMLSAPPAPATPAPPRPHAVPA